MGSRDSGSSAAMEKRLDLVLIVAKIIRCVINISDKPQPNEWLGRLLKMGVEDAEAFASGSGGRVIRTELEEGMKIAGT